MTPSDLEDAVISQLTRNDIVLAIDEAEYFAAPSINLVKLLLNRTRTVILLCAIPEAFDRWNSRHWHEASQLRRRTHSFIRHERVDPEHVKEFISTTELKPVTEKDCELISKAANQFGGYDFVVRTVNWMIDQAREGGCPVEECIGYAREDLGFPKPPKKPEPEESEAEGKDGGK
jgi:hypothetical protein